MYIGVEFPEIEEVSFWADIKIVDNGIGRYEYWGSIGFDSRLEPETQEIFWDKTLYSDEQNEIINRYVDNHFEEMAQKFEESYEGEGEPDPPEED
jgi:hypothetical protein